MSRRWLTVASTLGGVLVARSVLRRRRAIALDKKVVVVMGGSRGLGLVMARELVSRGARVALCARDADELERAKVDLQDRGGDVFVMPCDITQRDEVIRFIATVEDEVGPIDALINNAGIITVGPLELMTAEDFETSIDVNLRGPMHAALAVLPKMRKRKAGRIVNIASVGGKVAIPHLSTYSTSKFGLVGFSEALRAECAKDGIYVTTVCPGLMRTGSPVHAMFKGKPAGEYTWFSIAASNALSSVSAEYAATRIVDALVHGDSNLVVSPQAKFLIALHDLAPQLVQGALSLVTRFLPDAKGNDVSRRPVEGKDIDARLVPSVFTENSDEAAERNNETEAYTPRR